MKTFDWNKVESPLPVREIDKGQITRIPLDQAYGNVKDVVAPKLNYQPIPGNAIFPKEN
jgi:hypothetical protein